MSESTVGFELADDTPQNLRDYIGRLQKQAEEGTTAAEAAKTATRELAFTKAGIDPEAKKFVHFVKAYDGELTPEAIKAAAVEAELMEVNPAPPEQAAADRIAGAEGAGGGEVPDYRQSVEAFTNEMKKVHGEHGQSGLLEMLEKNGIGNSLVQ